MGKAALEIFKLLSCHNGISEFSEGIRVLILRRLEVRIMVLKTFNQVLNTDRPSRVSPGEASSWWRSDQRQTDHDSHCLFCLLPGGGPGAGPPCAGVFFQASWPLEVLLCVRRAGRPSVSLPPSFRPSLCLPLSPPPSSTVVLCTPGCGVTVLSTLLLACHPPRPSMGVRWEYLYAGTPVICSLVIFWHIFLSFTNSQANALNSKNEISWNPKKKKIIIIIMDWSDDDGVNYNNLCFDSM